MAETNTRKAPRLVFNGDKLNHKKDEYFYQIPIRLFTYLMSKIDGNNGNAIKLLCVLIGSSNGFNISEQMIMKRTGMSQSAYIRARKHLVDLGIINHINEKGNHAIMINFDNLWKEAIDFHKQGTDEILSAIKKNDELIDEGVLNDENGDNNTFDSVYKNSSFGNQLIVKQVKVQRPKPSNKSLIQDCG